MSVFGTNIKLSLFGASHEDYIGITLHCFPPGFKINEEKIREKLSLRRGLNRLTSKRFETDEFEIISGVFNCFSTGAPLTILIKNTDVRSSDYYLNKDKMRPSHGDYSSYIKSKGFNDYRGGGITSGRLTAAIVAIGAICDDYLIQKEIFVASKVYSLYNIEDTKEVITKDLLLNYQREIMPLNSDDIREEMYKKIEEVKEVDDSIGGVIKTYVLGLPAGIGNPFFDSVESILSHLMFSIPGVKGIEFGKGFAITKQKGSEVKDELTYLDDKITFKANNNGGINAGITNGDLIVFRTALKPTSSIGIEQHTINIKNKTNEILKLSGRHDAVIVVKALHVINALTSFGILDMYLGEYK